MQMPGGGMTFNYNRNEMIDEFSRYLITQDMPFNHDESQAYEYVNRKSIATTIYSGLKEHS